MSNGSYRDVAAPDARETRVAGINDAGLVVGYGYYSPVYMPGDPIPGSGADIRAFVMDQGGFRFPALSGRQSYAEAINSLNEVLGAQAGNGRFLLSLDTQNLVDLNELSILEDINDLGRIVGSYGDGTTMHGYIATPVPEPHGVSLLTVGASLLLLCIVGGHREGASKAERSHCLTLRPPTDTLKLEKSNGAGLATASRKVMGAQRP